MNKIEWRVLVVDDQQADDVEDVIKGNKVVDLPESISVIKCVNFQEAIERLSTIQVDIVILDLKDNSIEDASEELPGIEIFAQIKKIRFVPIIFNTGYPHRVKDFQNPFVHVVSRDEIKLLREAIKAVLQTGLPRLIRHLQNEQRDFMWDHIEKHWPHSSTAYEHSDLAYLLARRLASTLERSSVKKFLAEMTKSHYDESESSVQPIEMYVYPPRSTGHFTGDIIHGNLSDRTGYWVILTPSCDFQQQKASYVLLAACKSIKEQEEFKKVEEMWTSDNQPGGGKIKDAEKNLRDVLDNKKPRYHFLPGTFFLTNDLVVDFQSLQHLSIGSLGNLDLVTSLDNPFAEALVSRFIQYYGRLGTPDLDTNPIFTRIKTLSQKQQK